MNWRHVDGQDEWHEVWLLENDKGELLARVEGFGDRFYPWIMDAESPGLLRRLGCSDARTIGAAKEQVEKILGKGGLSSEGSLAEERASAYRGREIDLDEEL